jgi:c-di-GMP-binding flagellar brake protein YcgR
VHTSVQDRRRFIRHPVSIPLQCQREGREELTTLQLRDMSYGGLSFMTPQALSPGDCVRIQFPDLRHPGFVRGEIVWSAPSGKERDGRFVHGMRFQDEQEHLHARLIEQICHIETYRRVQEHQHGRKLSPQEAAQEWIARQAGRFPN